MRKLIYLISTIIISIASLLMLTSCKNDGLYKFEYQSLKANYTEKMYYSDDLFDTPSSKYSNSLATASLSLAMSSFSRQNGKAKDKSKNLINILDRLDFDTIIAYEEYSQNAIIDNFGVVVAKKRLNGKTLITVSARTLNFNAEWGTNITIGNAMYHLGYLDGANITLKYLKEYIKDNGITGDIKIWGYGYSASAGIMNIVASKIDEAIYNEDNIFGENINIDYDNSYFYTFDTPRTVLKTDDNNPKSNIYNNIYSIINYQDIASKLVFANWGFKRFGQELYLPDSIYDINFNDAKSKFYDAYYDIESSKDLGEYLGYNFTTKTIKFFNDLSDNSFYNYPLSLYLDDICDSFSSTGIVNQEIYASNAETGLREILQTIFSKYNIDVTLTNTLSALGREIALSDDVSLLMDDFIHNKEKLIADAKPLIKKALRKLGVEATLDEALNSIEYLLNSSIITFLGSFPLIIPTLSVSNLKAISMAHKAEISLAYLRSMDKNYTQDLYEYDMSGSYYVVSNKLNIDIKIGNTNILSIDENNNITSDENYNIAVKKSILSTNSIYLPLNAKYSLDLVNIKDISIKKYNAKYDTFEDATYEVIFDGNTYQINL